MADSGRAEGDHRLGAEILKKRQAPALLPYGRHLIDATDITAVARALQSDWLTTGPLVERFEKALATAVHAPHAVACSNGTTALHLAALALNLGPQDAVIVPSISFLASANGPHYTGAKIVFADVDPRTGLLTAETLNEAIGRAHGRARAVVAVHLNGQTCDMEAISRIARRNRLSVIEDACHALGTRDGRSRVGDCAHSDLACFSFHPVKTIAMGEGGAVTTRSSAYAAAVRRLRGHGITRDSSQFRDRSLAFDEEGRANPWYYEMSEPGFNYRVSDINCALGLSQLRRFKAMCARRRSLMKAYDRAVARWPSWIQPVPRVSGSDPVLHLYALLIDFPRSKSRSRANAMRMLAQRGIGTQVHYIPIHRQPYYRALNPGLDLPGADAYYARCLSIPFFPGMRDSDVRRVVSALEEVLLP